MFYLIYSGTKTDQGNFAREFGKQWLERLFPINLTRVRFPDPASYVGSVCCWISSLLEGFFSGFSSFPPSKKTTLLIIMGLLP